MNTRRKVLLVGTPLLLLTLLLLFLVGTNAGPGLGPSMSADGGGETAEKAIGSSPSGIADRSDGPARQTGRTVAAPLRRAVISTGQITLHAKDLGEARAEVLRLVTSWGGLVADEQSTADRRGRLESSTLTLRVPSARFSAAMTALGQLGRVEHESRSSQDVTTQVIDNEARIRAAERAIRQIERLLDRATRLSDIIAIESDLAQRQADLDSLKSQQAWLDDQTSLSTITVNLSRPEAPASPSETRGFLAGLERGWHSLGASIVVLLTILGAALPFGAVAALIGVPVWLLVRRRRVMVSRVN